MANRLHIVSFDVPYPANYGGIIDVFYKLKSLHKEGVEVTFHCFHYEGHNPPTDELNKYCSKVHYYRRKLSKSKLFFSRLPFIVSTRNHPELLINLLADPAPILFEGLHCTFWILHQDVQNQKILFRAHNIEHEYYRELAKSEKNLLKKLYLSWEAKKLEKYEWHIQKADAILAISKNDQEYFKRFHDRVEFVPAFFDQKEQTAEVKDYVLYHGNLSVPENEKAALHIVEQIAPKVKAQIIIAGKDPSTVLKARIQNVPNVELIASPSEEKMSNLLAEAAVHLLLSFQQTGLKLKLLHALQTSGHVIINDPMNDKGTFDELCKVLNDDEEIAKAINELVTNKLSGTELMNRKAKFSEIFDNQLKAKRILELLK